MLERGDSVICADNLLTGSLQNIAHLRNELLRGQHLHVRCEHGQPLVIFPQESNTQPRPAIPVSHLPCLPVVALPHVVTHR